MRSPSKWNLQYNLLQLTSSLPWKTCMEYGIESQTGSQYLLQDFFTGALLGGRLQVNPSGQRQVFFRLHWHSTDESVHHNAKRLQRERVRPQAHLTERWSRAFFSQYVLKIFSNLVVLFTCHPVAQTRAVAESSCPGLDSAWSHMLPNTHHVPTRSSFARKCSTQYANVLHSCMMIAQASDSCISP